MIGVALGQAGSKSLLAAQLSSEEIPGTPVVLNGEQIYTGPEGLKQAIERVIAGQLPLPQARKSVESSWDFWCNW